jgi:tRNA (mo5U34)-methyltransferase
MSVTKEWRLDGVSALEFAKVRQAVVGDLIARLRQRMGLVSALDVGCGLGHFSRFLGDLNFRVVAVDAREEIVEEAKQRNPDITFVAANAEEISAKHLETFDFVLCAGLVYHLENPFRAVRNLHELTQKVLFLESLTVPGPNPELRLIDENHGEDQGVNYVAFCPTESCLVKLLYRSGFPFVYGLKSPPNHPVLFDANKRRERVMLVASKEELSLPTLQWLPEPAFSFGMAAGLPDNDFSTFTKVKHFIRTMVNRVAGNKSK